MSNRCLNCQLPVQQVAGKRAKLYCNPKCKANYFFKQKVIENSSAMISITKVEYDRLKKCEHEINLSGAKGLIPKILAGGTYVNYESNLGLLVPEGATVSYINTFEASGSVSKKDIKKAFDKAKRNPINEESGSWTEPTNNILNNPARLPGESSIEYKIRCEEKE